MTADSGFATGPMRGDPSAPHRAAGSQRWSLSRRVTLGVAAAAIAILALPTASTPNVAVQVIATLTVAAIVLRGALRLPAAERRGWLLIASGVALMAVTDLILETWRMAAGALPFPTPLHIGYLIAVGALSAGLVAFVHQERRDRAALIDAIIVSACLGALAWPVVMQPLWEQTSGAFAAVYLLIYPILHLVVAFAVVRLWLHRRPRHAAHRLLIGAGVLHIATATYAGLAVIAETYVVSGPQQAGWLLANGAIAAAVTHPAAATTNVVLRNPIDRSTPGRAIVLFVVTMLLPVALLLAATTSLELVLAGVAAGVLALMSARMGLLLRQLTRNYDRELAEQTEREQRRFSALVRHTTDILIVIDPTGVVTYANPAAHRLYGTDPTGWTTERIVDFLHPDDRKHIVKSVLQHVEERAAEPIRLHARLADRGAGVQYIDLVVADLTDDPDVRGVVITIQDTTDRTTLERQLRHLAFHDALTDLGNRELFREHLERALRTTTESGSQLALFMCDLDDFKDVNDTLGHAFGDRLLQEVASSLTTATRDADTVARLGGDEFAILIDGVAGQRDAITLARRILDATREPIDIDGHRLRVGMSIGIALDDGGRTAEELLRDADIALYEAKEQGKRRWAVHRPAMTVRNQQRLQLADDLVVALADRQLEVHYQPVHDLTTGTLVGVEALARWHHPRQGLLLPATFIPLAEQSGLITALGTYVLDEALATLRRCTEVRPGLSLRMGVNVSARELREPSMVDRVIQALRRHEINPASLIFEITEGGMLEDANTVLGIMAHLRAQGVAFAVDDFGTGYSSLSYLRKLPVQIVKVDRSFVEDLDRDPTASDLVRAIVELGRTLELDVCAEGVETATQRELLENFGCRFAQGYLFARPESAAAFIARIGRADTALVIDERSPTHQPTVAAATPQVSPPLAEDTAPRRRRTDR